MDRLGVWGSEVVYNPPLRHQLVDSKMPLSYEGPDALNYFWRRGLGFRVIFRLSELCARGPLHGSPAPIRWCKCVMR